MVTLAVAVILAVIAVPSFASLMEKSRLRGATDDIVNLLNSARGSAVKLQRDVNVSISGTSTWCAGAISAGAGTTPTPGTLMPNAAACDCTATTVTCQVGDQNSGGYQNALVSSSNYSGVTLSSVNTSIAYVSSSSGVTFNSKFGALYLSALPSGSLVTVNSSSGKFHTNIFVSALGQTYVCVPSSSSFVSGYPSC
jgi:Tfp pilus assembly protein FimT